MKWSLVCPSRGDLQFLRISLPTFVDLHPDELLLVLDDPPPMKAVAYIEDVAPDARILTVPPNPIFHDAMGWVRRKGFLEAENDMILTSDDDLLLNANCHIAVNKVGDGVGLCSMSKFWPPRNIPSFYRSMAFRVGSRVWPARFTGLYAIYRPHWLETDDLETAKNIWSVKRGDIRYRGASVGEDTWLCNRMIDSPYQCMYRPEIGGYDYGVPYMLIPSVQFEKGRWFASLGIGFLRMIIKSYLYLTPHILRGWLHWQKHPDIPDWQKEMRDQYAPTYVERRHG